MGWILDEKITPGQQLAQGDLIHFKEEKDPLKMLGIVVTADCDLEKSKHGRLITLVPVLSVQTILERYIFIEACEKQKQQIFAYACKSYSVDSAGDENIAMAELRLRVDEAKKSAGDATQILAADFSLHLVDNISSASYKNLMCAIGSKAKDSFSIEKQLKGKGDIMVLPSPKDLGLNNDIAWVRHIWQVSLGDIALRTSDVGTRPGEKVARLDSPFRYRLTQILAQVFSDIGLPDVDRGFESEIGEVMEK